MPFNYRNCDCSPLVIDNEIEVLNEDLLAEYVGKIILGHFAHVKRIINSLSNLPPTVIITNLDSAIAKLTLNGKTDKDIEKRDGWVFQIISWLALFSENKGKKFFCQQPHDAPAQHGLDGVAVILSNNLIIENIIITEDKCSENQRVVIPKIWEEFEGFENGDYDNKLVSRISALIENLEDGSVLEANQNNIYQKESWKYRVGINRNNTYQPNERRLKLFKGYDGCVKGITPHRRYASTLHKDDIRTWMEQFCQKTIQYLESQKPPSV